MITKKQREQQNSMERKGAGKKLQGLFVVFFWLLIWQMITVLVKEPLLLQGPISVLSQLGIDLLSVDFYMTLTSSLIRMISGFFIGLILGIGIGSLSYFFAFLRLVMEPMVTVLKAIPIVSYVILILIWAGSSNLSVYMGILVVFPIVYTNILTGFDSLDEKMLELCFVYNLGLGRKFHLVYIPAMMPHLTSALKISIGMGFKAAVAAEVIGTPAFSIGEKIYMAKVHLQTAEIFSWTIVLILCSYLFEKGMLALLNQKWTYPLMKKKTKKTFTKQEKIPYQPVDIVLENVQKSFGEKLVIPACNLIFKKSGTYCIMGESGFGKTTLLFLISRLLEPDQGAVMGPGKKDIGMIFQENRLLMNKTAIENIEFVVSNKISRDAIREELLQVLPFDALEEKVENLSGGMARRVAIVRAMMSEKPILLLDEPFSGLDTETKKKVMTYILKKKENRTLLITTHQREDANFLQGEILYGNESGFNWYHGGRT